MINILKGSTYIYAKFKYSYILHLTLIYTAKAELEGKKSEQANKE